MLKSMGKERLAGIVDKSEVGQSAKLKAATFSEAERAYSPDVRTSIRTSLVLREICVRSLK